MNCPRCDAELVANEVGPYTTRYECPQGCGQREGILRSIVKGLLP